MCFRNNGSVVVCIFVSSSIFSKQNFGKGSDCTGKLLDRFVIRFFGGITKSNGLTASKKSLQQRAQLPKR